MIEKPLVALPFNTTAMPCKIFYIILAACLVCSSSLRAGENATPNIVVILADDMGYGDIHAMNAASTIPTPNLDALAAAGMTFTDAHSTSAVCTPSRYSLLTGRYCWRTRLKSGVLGGYSLPLLEPGRSTIGSLLKTKGYHTGMVGKWHLGLEMSVKKPGVQKTKKWSGDPGIDFDGKILDGPLQHGFDRFFGIGGSLDMPPYVFVSDDAFTMPPTLNQPAIKFPGYLRQGPRSTDFVIDDVLDRLTDEAVKFISSSAPKQQPYFLYLPLTGPHKPAQPHPRFKGKTGLNEYGDFVHQVDWTVGQVMQAIEKSGEAENTIVIYTSDNGSYMRRSPDLKRDHAEDSTKEAYRPQNHTANGNLRGTKADIWEAGHRVPFLVRWPKVVKPGSVCTQTICQADIYATCAEVISVDLKQNQGEDSWSLLPLLHGENVSRGAPVVHHSLSGVFAIRDGRWKLVAGNGSGGRESPKGKPFGKPFQLYDLAVDLEESNNLAASHPEVVNRLSKTLQALRTASRSVTH